MEFSRFHKICHMYETKLTTRIFSNILKSILLYFLSQVYKYTKKKKFHWSKNKTMNFKIESKCS